MRAPRQFPQFRYSVPEGATEILLVRHGESRAYIEGEPVESVDGQDDPPLTERGHLQAEAVADRLARRRVDAIYVSSLQRTQETAAPLAARTGLTPVVDPDLREVFLGSWEGGAYRQKVADRDPVALRIREEERWDVIPGAESPEVLTARLVGAIDRIVAAHPDGRVVAFTHAAALASLLAHATGARPFAFLGVNNGSITTLVVDEGRWVIRGVNDSAHLESIA